MSRIGNNPIPVPAGVTVKIDGNTSVVKGPKGEHRQHIPEGMTFDEKDGLLTITRPDESKTAKARHGLARALIANQMTGVTEGFFKKLEIIGVGWNAKAQGSKVVLNIGFCHDVPIEMPAGVTVETPKPTQIILTGSDKQSVGQIAAVIRAVRPPEPYKGKGIRYDGEYVRRKAGKSFGS